MTQGERAVMALVLVGLLPMGCSGTVSLGDRNRDGDSEQNQSDGGGSGGDGSAHGTGSAFTGTGGGPSAPQWAASPNQPTGTGAGTHDVFTPESLATRPDGVVLVGGALDPDSHGSGVDGFIVGYAPDGSNDLHFTLSSNGDDAINALSLDATGRTTFAGRIGGYAEVGAQVLSFNGDYDVVAGELDSGGTPGWAASFGYEGVQEALAIASAADSQMYVAGAFEGTILSGTDVLLAVGSRSAFVLKLDADGDWIWGRSWGEGWAVAQDIAIAPDGGVVVAGMFDGPLTVGDASYVSEGARDGLLVHVDTDGDIVWSHAFGNPQEQRVTKMAVGDDGTIAVVGRSSGPIDFGVGVTDAGSDAVFVVVYEEDGTLRWNRLLPVGADDSTVISKPSVVLDAHGNIIVAGGFQGQVDFGLGVLESNGGTDVFVAAWARDGAPLWSQRYGSAGAEAARALSYREGVGLTVAGTFFGAIDLGGGPMVSGSFDPSMFVAQLAW